MRTRATAKLLCVLLHSWPASWRGLLLPLLPTPRPLLPTPRSWLTAQQRRSMPFVIAGMSGCAIGTAWIEARHRASRALEVIRTVHPSVRMIQAQASKRKLHTRVATVLVAGRRRERVSGQRGRMRMRSTLRLYTSRIASLGFVVARSRQGHCRCTNCSCRRLIRCVVAVLCCA